MAEKTTVRCECGAINERTIFRRINREMDLVGCKLCGRTLEALTSSLVPVFRLIQNPDGSPVDRQRGSSWPTEPQAS